MLFLFGFSWAGALLTNGDFEENLNISSPTAGWKYRVVTPTYADSLGRDSKYNADPDYEVYVKKHHATLAKLYQTVNIPTTDLEFAASALMCAYEYPSTSTYYWSAAAIALRYLDGNNDLLGETRITNKSEHCPWVNSNTLHLINVTDTVDWYDYIFNINDELDNLPGINRTNIKKIQVAIIDTTNGC
jgi:hypothetical protein